MKKILTTTLVFLGCYVVAFAQTDQDAIMMDKKMFCTGFSYTHTSFTNYWEGDFKRDNANIGKISSNMYNYMVNYGITNKLNILANISYVSTKASAGTLHGQKGLQDMAVWAKWEPVSKKYLGGMVSLYLLGGYSFPVDNYIVDYLPLSIGLKSQTLSGRILLDYQKNAFFVTASVSYNYRNNITSEKQAYYTNQLILSNEVIMPNTSSYGIRIGYRKNQRILEALLYQNNVLGGFDIRKNDMPFPSNKMNSTIAGINFKYEFHKTVPGLAIIGGGNYTIAGRNVGQATQLNIGALYIIDFSRKKSTNLN